MNADQIARAFLYAGALPFPFALVADWPLWVEASSVITATAAALVLIGYRQEVAR